MIKSASVNKIYVESARAVARSVSSAEELYELSKQQGTKIVARDMPWMFEHVQNPAEKFMRRAMVAALELERDLLVHRMKEGRRTAIISPKMVIPRQMVASLCWRPST